MATVSKNASSLADNATPANMAAAGVPFALARWYHMIGRRLSRHSDWDVERIMDIRLRLAQCGM